MFSAGFFVVMSFIIFTYIYIKRKYRQYKEDTAKDKRNRARARHYALVAWGEDVSKNARVNRYRLVSKLSDIHNNSF